MIELLLDIMLGSIMILLTATSLVLLAVLIGVIYILIEEIRG